ncbi:ABC transporter permease [Chloroflexota bacterium]
MKAWKLLGKQKMLNPRWHKVIRDLWSNKVRTILVVLAIAVGVFAFGSVFITQEVLVRDMNTQYREINASTIIIYIRSFDDSLVRWAHRQEEVVDAQGRSAHLVKLVRENQTFNLDLNAYDDYEDISLNRISLQAGIWPPGRRDILLERSSFSVTGVDTGESILVEMPNGRQRELNVAGTVHDVNAIPANLFPQLTGYVSMKTMEWLGFSGTYNRLEITIQDKLNSLAELEKVADELKERLQRNGVSVDRIAVREPGEHWARETTQSFTLILSVIGIFSLILSGFLMVNTMTALLAEQRRQIGIMKAIGGTGRQIIGIYLVLVTCYGLLALLLAVPVGMGLAYLFTSAVTQFLNIDILNFHLPVQVIILQLIAALLVPIVASTIPVLGGVRVTAREAISDYGIGSKIKYGLLDRLLLKVRGLPRPVLLSLRNTFRRKGRLFLTLGTLTLAGALFITVMNVRGSMTAWSDDILETWFNYEVELYFYDDYPSHGIERRAESLSGVTQAEGRTGVQVQLIRSDDTRGAMFSVVGLPPDTDFVQPTMLSGRWLEEKDRNAVVLSSNLVEEMVDVQVGDEVLVEIDDKEYEWEVVGIMYMPFDSFGYTDFNYLSNVKGESGLASSMYVRTEQKDSESQSEMAKVLEKRLKESGIEVSQTMTKDVLASSWAGQFDFLIAFLLTMAAMTALIGGLGLAGMMSLNVLERTREIGVMRSIGARDSMVSGVVVTEGLLIGVISWALAIPISIPLSLVFNTMLGQAFFDEPLDFVFLPISLIAWLAIVVIVSVIASLLPAYRSTKMSIRETLAYE